MALLLIFMFFLTNLFVKDFGGASNSVAKADLQNLLDGLSNDEQLAANYGYDIVEVYEIDPTQQLSETSNYNFDNNNFNIVETIEDGVVKRTYIKDDSFSDKSETNYEDTKNLLRAMGMEDCFIEHLSEEDLELYANSSMMVGGISYTKSDNKGNVEQISEEQALREVNELNKIQEKKNLN